jgi:hypothetical protein
MKPEKAATMIIAAAVTIWPVRSNPIATARLEPYSCRVATITCA